MRLRQSPWKWLLVVVVAIVAAGLALLYFRPFGTQKDLRDRVTASLADWTGGRVMLTGPLKVRYFPPSVRGGLVLSDATNLPGIDSITAQDFQAYLGLPGLIAGDIQMTALRLDKPVVKLKRRKPDAPANSSVTARLTTFLANAPIETIRIHGGVVEPPEGNPLFRQVDVRMNTRGQIGALEAVGSFDFNSESVTFSYDRGRVGKSDEFRTAPVTLKVTSKPLTARYSGRMRVGGILEGDGDLEASTPDARAFLNWLGVALPAGESLKNARASGRVHWSGPTLTFDDGTFEFDGNEAVGLLALSMGERPRIEGTLAFEQLTLDPYLPELAASDDPIFDWVLLKHIDADLRVSAAEVVAEGLSLGHGGFTINAKGGKIASEIGELGVCGGQAEGRLDLDLSGERSEAAFSGNVGDLAIETCLGPYTANIPIKGTGTVKADISTGGTTRDELVRGVAGTLKIAASNGVVPIDLLALLNPTTDDLGDTSQDGWGAGPGMVFTALNADCSLSAGHLWCRSVDIDTGKGKVSGAGGLDVAQQTLDWDFLMADPVAPLDASQRVMDRQPRVTVNGTLSAPLIKRVGRSNTDAGSTEPAPESQVVAPR